MYIEWLRYQLGRRVLSALLGVLLSLFSPTSFAENMELAYAKLEAAEDGWYLNADYNFDLNSQLEGAINKGMTLYFVLDFELKRPRWYWFDESAATVSQTWRLSFQPLTRQYRLSAGGLQQRFSSLPEAIQVLRRLRHIKVMERNAVKPDQQYQASIRMRLDTSQLPKPFQAHAVNSRDWNLASEWVSFGFNPALSATAITGSAPEEK
ncbi:DUF4390 domain-containing protein [Ampullimonas aquatilis]|uniref:DUF4390 domain-containing protein n=1 Tax=Ampullimonas aquatilis TaxID=1341549 RepID=UPI003C783A9C